MQTGPGFGVSGADGFGVAESVEEAVAEEIVGGGAFFNLRSASFRIQDFRTAGFVNPIHPTPSNRGPVEKEAAS